MAVQTWLQTPDNRQGWASYFLDQGYAVFLVDVVSVGRSSRLPQTATTGATAVEVAEAFFSASEKFPTNYPQAKLHTQWPGVSLPPTQPGAPNSSPQEERSDKPGMLTNISGTL